MTEWIDVPVAEVAVGDEVKAEGYAVVRKRGTTAYTTGEAYPTYSMDWMLLQAFDGPDSVTLRGFAAIEVSVRRSSIVAARRRKLEPAPKPGKWRCKTPSGFDSYVHVEAHNSRCEVYRAGSGWSPDTRTGQPWGMKGGDPVEVTLSSYVGGLTAALGTADIALNTRSIRGGESWSDYYRRIGLDVRPVERRGKR